MTRLQDYLDKKYIQEKEQVNSVLNLIKKALPIFTDFNDSTGWSYIVNSNESELSTSTLSMIAFAMSVLLNGKYDLIIDEKCDNYFQLFFDKSIYFNEILDTAKNIIKKSYRKSHNNFKSNTFGNNDPFTMMWFRSLLVDDIDRKPTCDIDNDFYNQYKNLCVEKVKRIFKDIYVNKYGVEFSDGNKIESTHMFPLLKVIQLYCSLESKDEIHIQEDEENNIKAVKATLINNLHHHLSLENIENSNFDAAELVFSLEGLLLLDQNKDNFDDIILSRVFEVIKKRQNYSLYWRPLKPFVLDKKGLALLPLSVEIAMSLIRICRLLGEKGERVFSKYVEIFNKYTEWLKTRIVTVPIKKSRLSEINKLEPQESNITFFYGWCSEHVYQPDVIHLWETSQVLVYLVNYKDMLQKHIAYYSLRCAGLSTKSSIKKPSAWAEWIETEPVAALDNYLKINDYYIENQNKFSMLLYGPPGTGKSTIAEKIAETLGWPLITITPSDFVASGVDQVETKSKNIFKVLCEQKEKVIFFDEIDRLILDRDSDYYSEQSDMFQFMTPSMLVKIKDLRVKEKCIFIIGTNYEERIDKAIKRAGRIDKRYLILPPDKSRRINILINENENKSYSLDVGLFDKIADATPLYTYTELTHLLETIKDEFKKPGIKNDFDSVKHLIAEPSISLLSYKNKIGIDENEEKNAQTPKQEFLSLVFLKAETTQQFKRDEINLIIDFLKSEQVRYGNLDCIKIKLMDNQSVHVLIDLCSKALCKKEKKEFTKRLQKYLKEESNIDDKK